MLFKPSYVDKFATGIAEAILVYSRNGATSILLIGEVVRSMFYKNDLGRVVNDVKSNLHREDFRRDKRGPGARLGRGGAYRRDRGGCGAGDFLLYLRAVQLPSAVAKARVLPFLRKTSELSDKCW